MFTIKAGYSNDIEIRSSIERVREFFLDITNFAELMPGVVNVHTDSKGLAHWKIQTEIPVVGQILQSFTLELSEHSADRVEWLPMRTEAQNFLRYSADFLEKAKNVTLVHFSQMVELRRRSARDLHMLAGLAGEAIISKEMTKRVTEMIRVFIEKAKHQLEK
ncbi:MAG TPA: SRPBCC family protein [Pyrinomonadaceae bacterium]|nr:SRPBCC family protein [Pyrinomonadaceae bacterium]